MSPEEVEAAGGLVLSLERLEKPVMIGGECYVMREWTGDAKAKYDADKYADLDVVIDGDKRSVKNPSKMAGNEPLLVSLCLFRKNGSGDYEPVSEKTVRSWTGSVQSKLYQLARTVCRMDEVVNPKA